MRSATQPLSSPTMKTAAVEEEGADEGWSIASPVEPMPKGELTLCRQAYRGDPRTRKN